MGDRKSLEDVEKMAMLLSIYQLEIQLIDK
jgi:hypothetical protein